MLAVASFAGCAAPPPPPTATAAIAPITTASPGAPSTESPEATVTLDVRMDGRIGCAQFPYGCTATVSALPPDTAVPDSWRPPTSDPRWSPDFTNSIYSSDHLRAQPDGAPPLLAPGRHLVVVSLLGSYDTPSFNPDGSLATDLLARCSADVDVPAGSPPLAATVTFASDATSFGGTCSITVRGS